MNTADGGPAHIDPSLLEEFTSTITMYLTLHSIAGCLAAQTYAAAFSNRSASLLRPMRSPVAFVHSVHHPSVRIHPTTRRVFGLLRASESNHDQSIDLQSLFEEDSDILSPQQPTSWSIADDWEALSSSSAASTAYTTPTESSLDSRIEVMEAASRIMEEQDQMMNEQKSHLKEWGTISTSDVSSSRSNDDRFIKDELAAEDHFVEDAVEIIASHLDYNDTTALYDTVSPSTMRTKGRNKRSTESKQEQQHEDEIAFMIRCNQTPGQFLISQGRALPELTDEEKHSAEFLLERDEQHFLPLKAKMTPFFKEAVEKIFDTYAVDVEVEEKQFVDEDDMEIKYIDNLKISKPSEPKLVFAKVMDRNCIAAWMTQCLSSPFGPNKDQVTPKQLQRVGAYDKSISALISRYSQTGSGRLTLEEFQSLYLECAWAGYCHRVRANKEDLEVGGKRYEFPSTNVGVVIKGRQNTESMILKGASLDIVWRDLEAHSIFSPAEDERIQMLLDMEHLASDYTIGSASANIMDECELFEEYEERLSQQAFSEGNDNDLLGGNTWSFSKRKEKSSHQLVEMASDEKTPLRIRDGQFVFIDEESCIGCSQVGLLEAIA